MRSLLRFFAFLLGALILLVVLGAVAGAPPEHDAVSPYGGSTTIKFQVASSDPQKPIEGPLAPTTSLTNARCEAWLQSHSGTCPDDVALARDYWPDLQPEPRTLYVGILSSCPTNPSHFNVEYFGSNAVADVYLHCHSAAPWVSFDRPSMGVSAQITTILVLIPTSGMQSGILYVVLENRVERWLVDDVNSTLLGVVTIPS